MNQHLQSTSKFLSSKKNKNMTDEKHIAYKTEGLSYRGEEGAVISTCM